MKKRRKKWIKKIRPGTAGLIFTVLFVVITFLIGAEKLDISEFSNAISFSNTVAISDSSYETETYLDISSIPEYSGEIYVYINDNIPYFEESEYTTESFENYSELDSLGRCGVAYANICKELMPTDDRDSISSVTPTGWVQAEYDGEYLYNRCHLIGYQLAGENANELNLITGTRTFNVDGMLPFENMVDDYIEENEDNHVLYRVTPIFEESNLVASGVEMEAYSVEDNGEGVCFNVYVYNVEPGVTIDDATGESSSDD